ncbi:MAG: SDR family NAD(P)-dependent oxidoreductase [Panacagrimonas sp.]
MAADQGQRKLEGRVAVITGAARGLGVALATQFAKDGARIVIADRSGETLPQVAEQLLAAGSPDVKWIAQDLSKEEGADATIELAVQSWGRIDILVNNAGGGIIRPFMEHTADTLRETLDRNLWTTIWCIRAALRHMLPREYGRVVNISADSVHTGIWSHAGYNAAKGGVNGLTTGLAFEFARRGITVNCVSPGGIATDEVKAMFDPKSEVYAKHQMIDINKALERIPNGRLTELDEVAALTAFLTYDNTRAINGQIYSINGGQWMM